MSCAINLNQPISPFIGLKSISLSLSLALSLSLSLALSLSLSLSLSPFLFLFLFLSLSLSLSLSFSLLIFPETFAATVKSVAASLRRVALSLEHHGGLVLRDSSFHHCWSFPPYEYFEALRLTLSREEECLALSAICHEGGKTCNCGAVSLSQLPMDCVWEGMRESVIVPEGLYLGGETKKGGGKMKENTRRSSKQPSNNVDTYTDVCVCDPYEAKLAALCLAGDIASTILRVGLTSVHVDAL